MRHEGHGAQRQRPEPWPCAPAKGCAGGFSAGGFARRGGGGGGGSFARGGGGGGDGDTAKSPKIVIISGLLPFNFASLYVSYKYLYEAQQGLSGTDPSSLANMYLNHLNMRLHDLQEFSFNQEVLAIMSLDRWTRSMFMLMREYVKSNFSGMLWIGYAMYSAGYEMTFLCQFWQKNSGFPIKFTGF